MIGGKSGASWERSEVGVRSMPVKETHPRERGSRVTGDGMRLYRRIARARGYTLVARTPRETRVKASTTVEHS